MTSCYNSQLQEGISHDIVRLFRHHRWIVGRRTPRIKLGRTDPTGGEELHTSTFNSCSLGVFLSCHGCHLSDVSASCILERGM